MYDFIKIWLKYMYITKELQNGEFPEFLSCKNIILVTFSVFKLLSYLLIML